jgi:transposase
MSISMIGLDTAKSVFQVHAVDETGQMVMRRKLQRSELIAFFKKLPGCVVVMEACGAAHHWARMLTGLGHDVKLVAPEVVKPFIKKGKKNDAADAAAICTAASRPDTQFIPAKSLVQQDVLALHSVRSLLVKQQTMLANAIRGLVTEFGLTASRGIGKLGELMTLVDTDETIPERARRAVKELYDQCGRLDDSIEAIEAQIVAHARHDESARRLATIPGIGPITASLIVATVVDFSVFKSARHFAAWLGLVPRQHSTGGKTRLGRITKTGNREIRRLLVLGATSMVYRSAQWNSTVGAWTRGLLLRRPVRLVTVALANKTARIAWAKLAKVPTDRSRSVGMPAEGLMTRNEVYRAKGCIVTTAKAVA